MTTLDRAAQPARSDSVFYPGMALGMALAVFAGFSRSFYLKSVFHAPPPLSVLMIAHGLVFTSWIAILVTQTGFVAANRRDLHRKLGVAGAGIAVLMVVLGFWLAVDALRRGDVAAGAPSAEVFFAIPVFSIAAFPLLGGVGIAFRARPAWHKRFMILSTAALLPAAFARIPLAFIVNNGPPAFYGLSDLFIVAMALYDVAKMKRIHPATLWAGAIIVAAQVLSLALGGTPAWHAFAIWVMA